MPVSASSTTVRRLSSLAACLHSFTYASAGLMELPSEPHISADGGENDCPSLVIFQFVLHLLLTTVCLHFCLQQPNYREVSYGI